MEKKTKKMKMPDGMREMSPCKASMFPVVGHLPVYNSIPCTAQASSNPAVLKGPDNCDFPHLNHIRAAIWATLQDQPKVLVCGYLSHDNLFRQDLMRLVSNPTLTPEDEHNLLQVSLVVTDVNFPTAKLDYMERMSTFRMAMNAVKDEDLMRSLRMEDLHTFDTPEQLYSHLKERLVPGLVMHSAKGEFGKDHIMLGELPITTEFRIQDFNSNDDGRLMLAMRAQSGDKFYVPMGGPLEVSTKLLNLGGGHIIGRTAVVKHISFDGTVPKEALCSDLK